MLVVVAALLWIALPAAAQECPPLTVEPPDGQVPGGTILIFDQSGYSATMTFSLGGELLATDGYTDTSHPVAGVMATVPDLAAGTYTLAYEYVVVMLFPALPIVTYCEMEYTVLLNILPILPFLTVPTFAMIDDATVATAPTTNPAPTTPAPAAAPLVTAAPTPGAVEDPTTLPAPTSAVSETTLVAAAPQPTDGTSNGMLIGLLIGVAATAVVVSAWALGRRGRTAPTYYQSPPPPPG